MTGESVESLVKRYRNKGYGHLKIDTAEAVIQELKPLQDRFRDVMDSGEVQRALARGAERAREVAGETLSRMQQAMGLVSK